MIAAQPCAPAHVEKLAMGQGERTVAYHLPSSSTGESLTRPLTQQDGGAGEFAVAFATESVKIE